MAVAWQDRTRGSNSDLRAVVVVGAVTVALCSDLSTARAALRAGGAVVLVGLDGDTLGREAAALRSEAPGSRVGIFVGDPDDDAVWAAAGTMAAELYGGDARRVTTMTEADELPFRTAPTAVGTEDGTAVPAPSAGAG
jgi:hypothetical protein